MAGSALLDEFYRSLRRDGLDETAAIREVFRSGFQTGGDLDLSEDEAVAADAVYRAEKLAGRSHVEALDELFLAGYVLARDTAVALA